MLCWVQKYKQVRDKVDITQTDEMEGPPDLEHFLNTKIFVVKLQEDVHNLICEDKPTEEISVDKINFLDD